MGALPVFEGVGIGHEVAAHPISVDYFLDPHSFAEVGFMAGRDVLCPAHRLIRDAKGPKDLIIEITFAQQQLVDSAQKLTGLGALNNAVVIG